MKTFRILITLCVLTFFGCAQENTEHTEPVKQLTKSEIVGVWTDPNNDLYFLALSNDGKYSLCLNSTLMGAGTYEFSNNTLTLYNAYLFTKDEISVSKKSGMLNLSGHILTNKGLFLTPIDCSLKKTNESYPKSVVLEERPLPEEDDGYSLPPNYVGYSKIEQIATYLTEYTAYFISRGKSKYTNKWETFCEYEWYYVYRAPYTYTQLIDGTDGTVTIYNLDKTSLHKYLTTNIVEQ